MKISDLNGKNVCILGFGREGQAVLKALENHHINADITIADQNQKLKTHSTSSGQAKNQKLITGSDYLEHLEKFDIIIKSPGIPPHPLIDAGKDKVTSSTQIFLDTIADSGALVIGVTGSKGKSTTSSLIYEILKADGRDVHLIGNIGKPSIDYLDLAKENTIFVMEMSSYQLMDVTVSPEIAVVTSFFPEHLDYHGSLEAYKEAKKHIARFQKKSDRIYFDGSSDGAEDIAKESKGKKIPAFEQDAPVALEETKLIGAHNLRNIALAFLVASSLDVSHETSIEAIKNFQPLPHRLQSLGIHHGIEWVDDAISTTPESTIAALDALGDRVKTIILGGQDRGNDFTELGKRIVTSSVEHVILFPGSGERIKKAIQSVPAPHERSITFYDAPDMQTAVKIARRETNQRTNKLTSNGTPICLLSTASPSYNMFKNFEEKGEMFQKFVLATSA